MNLVGRVQSGRARCLLRTVKVETDGCVALPESVFGRDLVVPSILGTNIIDLQHQEVRFVVTWFRSDVEAACGMNRMKEKLRASQNILMFVRIDRDVVVLEMI